MENKKSRIAEAACGKAKILPAGALSNCILAITVLLAIGAGLQFAGIELFQPTFAEMPASQMLDQVSSYQQPPSGNSHYRSMSESMSVVASHGGANAPTSHYRTMSESMSVTSVQGKAPNSYSRSMSEQASLTTGTPPSTPAGSQPRVAPSPASPYSASSNQRIDERLSSTLKMLGKKGDTTEKNAIGGTRVLATEFLGSTQVGSPDQFSETGETSDEASPDDSSALLRQLDDINEYMIMQKSLENAALANLSTSAVLLLGAAVVVVGRQPAVSGGRLQKKVYAIFRFRAGCYDWTTQIQDKHVTYVLLLVLVIFTVSSIVNAIDPLADQAFAAISYVGAGTAVSDAPSGSGTLQPGLPNGLQSDDLMVTYYYSNTDTGSVSISSGWTLLYDDMGTSGHIAAWYRFYQAGDTAPTITASGLQTGNPNGRDNIVAQIAAWRGVDTADPIDAQGTVSTNGSQQNIGAITGITVAADSVVIVVGGKLDDWTSVAPLTGDSLTWSEIGELASTSGADAGMVWDYAINGDVQKIITAKTFTVTGGTSQAGKGVMFSLNVKPPIQVNLSETMGMTDNISAKVTLRAVVESLSISDTISFNVNRPIAELMAVTDIVARSLTVSRTMTDQLTVQDTISIVAAKTVSEQLNITDALAAVANLERTTSEQLAIDDPVSTVSARPLSEQLVVTGSIQRSIVAGSAPFEQLAMADNLAKAVSKQLAESLVTSDTVARSVIQPRAITGQMTTTDSIAISTTKQVSEQLSTTESPVRSIIISRMIIEQLAAQDTLFTVVARALSEQLALTDVLARNAVVTRSMTEQLTMTDTVAKATLHALAEQLGIQDMISSSNLLSRSVSEQLSVQDAVAKLVSAVIAEQLAITDSSAKTLMLTISVSEQLGMTETMTKTVLMALMEQLALAEMTAKTAAFEKLISEQLTTVDAISKSIPRTMAEQLAIQDTLARSATLLRTTAEQLAARETISKALSKAISEQTAMTDQITRGITLSVSTSEQLAVIDALAVSIERTVSESVNATDTVARMTIQSRSIVEPLTMQETVSIVTARATSEQLDMTDTIARTLAVSRVMTEQSTMIDAASSAVLRSLTAQLGIIDNIQRSTATSRTLSEQLAMNETIAKVVSTTLSEQLTMTEMTVRISAQSRSMAEQFAVTDNVSTNAGKIMTEQLTISDTVDRSVVNNRSVTEQIILAESIAKSISTAVSEQFVMTETAAKSSIQSKSATEQFAVQDAISVATTKMLSERLTLTENFQRSVVSTRTPAEQMEVADIMSKSISMTISDQLTLTEAITKAVSKTIAESLGMSDSPARSAAQLGSMSEQLTIAESIIPSVAKSVSEQMGVSDSTGRSIILSRTMSEQLAITDALGVQASSAMVEQLATQDMINVSTAISRSATESMSLTESVVASHTKSLPEQLAVSDSITAVSSGTEFVTDQIDVTESITIAVTKSVTDQLATTESAIPTSAIQASDQLGVTDNIAISIAISMTDDLALSDSITATAAGVASTDEQLGTTESVAISISKQVSDTLALADAAIASGSTTIADSASLSDMIIASVTIARSVSDSLTLSDTISGAPAAFVMIGELMSIGDSFADIAMLINLDLGEPLVLAQSFATNFSGSFNQVDNEGIIIADNVTLSLTGPTNRSITETLGIQDLPAMLVMIPPPSPPAAIAVMPALKMAETDNSGDLADTAEAVGIDGEWDISDLDESGLEEMLADMGMPVYDVGLEAASSDIDDFTMILPAFWVSMKGEWANDAAFLTPTLSDLPAGMQVIVPINVAGSMDSDSGLQMLGNMTMSFTTAESAGNFTMLIIMLNNNPESDVSDDPANDLPAFFIDVTAVGDFVGLTPGDEEFFEEPPRLTFTLAEEWADDQSTERDSNGVPIFGLFLLDESDGSWLEMTPELDSPTSAIDGAYTYTATLPHLSTFVVTAGEADEVEADDSSGGAGSGSRTGYIRSLVESMLITDTADIPGEGRELVKEISESLVLTAVQLKPLQQRVIAIHNVTVAVSVADVKPATVGAAVATLNFVITNRNGGGENLVLSYTYSDSATGRTLYDGEWPIMVDAGESIVQSVEVPFYSEGVYDLKIHVESEDGTLASTDILISVPWLSVYLYLLIAAAAIVIAVSAFFVLYSMRKSRSSDRDGK